MNLVQSKLKGQKYVFNIISSLKVVMVNKTLKYVFQKKIVLIILST